MPAASQKTAKKVRGHLEGSFDVFADQIIGQRECGAEEVECEGGCGG
jgi:hypothetical protein